MNILKRFLSVIATLAVAVSFIWWWDGIICSSLMKKDIPWFLIVPAHIFLDAIMFILSCVMIALCWVATSAIVWVVIYGPYTCYKYIKTGDFDNDPEYAFEKILKWPKFLVEDLEKWHEDKWDKIWKDKKDGIESKIKQFLIAYSGVRRVKYTFKKEGVDLLAAYQDRAVEDSRFLMPFSYFSKEEKKALKKFCGFHSYEFIHY